MEELSDLEITKLCAEAMGYHLTGGYCSEPAVRVEINVELSGKNHFREFAFDPLHDDAQAMALVKKFEIDLIYGRGTWLATVGKKFRNNAGGQADVPDLNRAICLCVSKMQEGR